MNRNTEAHFAQIPKVNIQRSIFDKSFNLKTSFNMGSLIPIYAEEAIPGDTFTVDTALVLRTTSPLVKPVMDNLFLDIFYFAVPMRLVWKHFKEFMGENTSGPWTQKTEYTIPQITAPATTGWQKGTLADYFTIPTKVKGISISALWARAYCLIWNEYFRDQNLQNPTQINDGDSTYEGSNGGTLETDAQYYGKTLPVNKTHDYFTSCLPSPQKGQEVSLPLGNTAPIVSTGSLWLTTKDANPAPVKVMTSNTPTSPSGTGTMQYIVANKSQDNNNNSTTANTLLHYYQGLETDLSQATAATINNLRQAFAIQSLFEKDARGGTRYIELVKSHFGVTSPDARLQRPEYLGGKRIPLNFQNVVQTSGTESSSGTQTTPQGNISSYSHTTDEDSSFTKSFTEHTMIIGLACVRTYHTYQQGIERMFTRKRRFDFYWPALANLGEQPVKNKEIYAQGTNADEEVFGYQEAWAEYRYKPNKVTGQMRSNAEGTLDLMHFADKYTNLPKLGQSWIQETKDNLDRCLAVPSTTSDQFMADIQFNVRAARPMPTYSIPATLGRN